MAKHFRELRERLLRAGVAPRHVRRYVMELREHLADLTVEEQHAGRSRAEAEASALRRLGRVEDLAQSMIARRELQSWTARAPWAVLGLAPLAALSCAWAAALMILWTGWQWFEPDAATPFGARVQGLAMYYFGLGRMLYFWAPVLAGWGMVLLAGRQRVKAWWPVLTLALLALLGATGWVVVSRPGVPGPGHVRLGFWMGLENLGAADGASHALVLFALTVLPYAMGRWIASRSDLARE
ncbi:MAG: hypothetical protein WBG54_22145 [Acidobacteriaceae bacterium]